MAPRADTIVAISTPSGVSDLGVIRLSGVDAIRDAEEIFIPQDPSRPLREADWRSVEGVLRLGRSGTAVPARCAVMRAPHSYTREDQVEITLPGSPRLLEIAVDLLRRAGARPAEAGEFTRRAYLNGRIDLTRVEAVAAVIGARDEEDRRAALFFLRGRFSREVRAVRDAIVALLVPVEIDIDFAEEGIEFVEPRSFVAAAEDLARRVEDLIGEERTSSREGDIPRAVLVGPTNAGKSSLFNALGGADHAIVSPREGTTRDYIERRRHFGTHDIVLVDTAGTGFERADADRLAAERRREQLERAQFVIQVRDGRRPWTLEDGDCERPSIRVSTRADCVPPSHRSLDSIWFSAVTGEGLADVEAALARLADAGDGGGAGALAHLRARHAEILDRAACALRRAADVSREGGGGEFIAADLREALTAMEALMGGRGDDAVLDRIMRDFCIGK